MRVIRVDVSSATILLTEAPAPKVRDRQTGEIAKDAVSGEALMTVGVVYIDEGDSSIVQVTIPERRYGGPDRWRSGVPAGARRPAVGERVQRPAAARHRLPRDRDRSGCLPGSGRSGGLIAVTDLITFAELGGPLAAIGGAAYARHANPAAYWSTVGLPVSVARLLASYSSTMDACGLTVEPSRLRMLAIKATTRREVRPVPPRRGIIRPTTTGMRVRLRLAPGQEPADVAASAERLRHAWGVHAVYVKDVKPGVVELRLIGFDVLRKVRMPRRTDGGFLKVPVALREDAAAFVRDYRAVPHELVLGATLSGKSMYLRNLIVGLAQQPVALVGIDCKRGVELAPFASRFAALATDPDEAAELLPVLVKEMEDRYDLIKSRQGIAPAHPTRRLPLTSGACRRANALCPSSCSWTRWQNSSSSPPARTRSGGTRWSLTSSGSPSSAGRPASTWRSVASASAPSWARAPPCSGPSSPAASATASMTKPPPRWRSAISHPRLSTPPAPSRPNCRAWPWQATRPAAGPVSVLPICHSPTLRPPAVTRPTSRRTCRRSCPSSRTSRPCSSQPQSGAHRAPGLRDCGD